MCVVSLLLLTYLFRIASIPAANLPRLGEENELWQGLFSFEFSAPR